MAERLEKIEPCIKGRCWSPIACSDFGYCRDRNHEDPPCTPEKIAARRRLYGRATPAQPAATHGDDDGR